MPFLELLPMHSRKVLRAAPSITTSTLPDATIGGAYSQNLAVTGTAGGTWSVASGTLASGLSLSASGTLSGTPDTGETANFTVRYVDPEGQADTQALSVTVNVAPEVANTPDNGTEDEVYNFAMAATGGTSPLAWSATSLPTGLSIDEGTGVISGTPTTADTYATIITVEDANGVTDDLEHSFVIEAGGPALTLHFITSQDVIHTEASSYTVEATNHDDNAGQITPSVHAGTATVLRDVASAYPKLKVSSSTYTGGLRTIGFMNASGQNTMGSHDGSGTVNSSDDLLAADGFMFCLSGVIISSGFSAVALTHAAGISGVLSIAMDYVDGSTIKVGILHTDSGGTTPYSGNVAEGAAFKIGVCYDSNGKLTVDLDGVLLADEEAEGALEGLSGKQFFMRAPTGWEWAVHEVRMSNEAVSKAELLAQLAEM